MQQVKHAYGGDKRSGLGVESDTDVAVNHEEHAFENRTDFANEDFIYVY